MTLHHKSGLGGLGAVVFAAMSVSPAYAGTVQGQAEVAIVSPLTLVADDALDFGTLLPGTTAGTVTITPTGTRTATAGITLVGMGHSAGSFAGQGQFNQRVRVRVVDTSITLTGPGPAMTVDNFTLDTINLTQIGNSPNYRISAANGIFVLNVGGRLHVGANQVAGHYSGTFTVTADYF